MTRSVMLVIDSFGIGAMKDVTRVRPQDAGANTCGHILGELSQLWLSTLEKLGLINTLDFVPGAMRPSASIARGAAELQHEGEDTFMGHQETLGMRSQAPLWMPFNDIIGGAEQALKTVGWYVERRGDDLAFLWANDAAAVDDNLEVDLGQVYDITANLTVIPLDEVLKMGRMIRERVQVGRVIAFDGQLADSQRILDAAKTKEGCFIGINAPYSGACENSLQARHMGFGVDEQVQVPQKPYDAGILTVLVGKVADIAGSPHGRSWQNLADSQQIMDIMLNKFNTESTALICANIQEIDLVGHAEDVERYVERLRLVDLNFSRLLAVMGPNDCLVVMVDHGNDPTTGHSYHTQEVVPVLIYQQGLIPAQLGIRTTLSDVGATMCEFFGAVAPQNGCSFLSALRLTGDIL